MKKKLIMLSIFATVLAVNMYAATADAMPWESGLEKVMNSISGPTAKIIGVLLIVGGGFAVAFTEGQAIKKLLWIVFGLGIALNAASFIAMLFGSTSGMIIALKLQSVMVLIG